MTVLIGNKLQCTFSFNIFIKISADSIKHPGSSLFMNCHVTIHQKQREKHFKKKWGKILKRERASLTIIQRLLDIKIVSTIKYLKLPDSLHFPLRKYQSTISFIHNDFYLTLQFSWKAPPLPTINSCHNLASHKGRINQCNMH